MRILHLIHSEGVYGAELILLYLAREQQRAGHEPLMSATVAYLLNSPSLLVDMKKAALVRIDVERPAAEPRGVLKWMLTPALSLE